MSFVGSRRSEGAPANNALHTDRGRIFVSRDTAPLQRPRRVNWCVRRLGSLGCRVYEVLCVFRLCEGDDCECAGGLELRVVVSG